MPGFLLKRFVFKKALPLAAVLSLAAIASPAFAQNREKAWEINPYVGYMSFSEVEGQNVIDDTWDIGFRFGYHWTKKHMVEFGFFGGTTESPQIDVTVDLLGGQIDYIYNFFVHRRDRVVLFVDGGVGLINTSSFGFVANPEAIGDEVHLSYNFGGGIRLFGGPRTGFRMDVRRVAFSDDDVDIDFLETTIGMTIVLGGAY